MKRKFLASVIAKFSPLGHNVVSYVCYTESTTYSSQWRHLYLNSVVKCCYLTAYNTVCDPA